LSGTIAVITMNRLKLTSMFGVAAALLAPFVLPATADARTTFVPQITNSQDASAGEYPYMVALVSSGSDDNFQGQFCGGSVIDAEWVLTAGHCVVTDGETAPADSIDVLIGAVDLTTGEGTRVAADQIVAHPGYDDAGEPQNDVALIHLSTPTDAEPVRLATSADSALEVAGTDVVLTGWGGLTTDQADQTYAERLQEATMPIVSDATCATELGSGFDATNALCAGAPEDDADGGVDACQGDSGGPLVASDAGERVQVGIVSWGPTCGLTLTAYGRVSAFTDFIEETMGSGPVDPDPTDGVLDNTTRLAGTTRYATAAELATDRFEPGVSAVFVATGLAYADALAAAPAASAIGAPVLLTTLDQLPVETVGALQQLDPQMIFVVGGSGAVSEGVVTQLQGFTAGEVVRIAGDTRYETAALLSSIAFPDGLGGELPAFLASGETFADALSGAAAAAEAPQVPLLMTQAGSLPAETIAELDRLDPIGIVIFGGTGAVSENVEQQLIDLGWSVERFAGSTRYETSAIILEAYFEGDGTEVVAATGTNFPDGLVAGALGLPLILVPPGDDIPSSTATAIEGVASDRMLVLGGTGAISDDQALELDELVGG
jgi:secreted trypsin-like serine protease